MTREFTHDINAVSEPVVMQTVADAGPSGLGGLQGVAFDPFDNTSGTLGFLDGDLGFFQHMVDALFADTGDALPQAGNDAPAVITNATVQVADAQAVTDAAHAVGRSFATGAVLQTDKGQKAVQDIRAGDRVLTRDHGFRPVVRVGHRRVSRTEQLAEPALRPVLISRGALGPALPDRPMQVSPDHGFLVEGPRTKLLFGTREVLVPAAHLLGYPGITTAPLANVDYFYLLCAEHQVIWADGVWTESAQPQDWRHLGISPAALALLFPQDAPAERGFPAARRTLQRHEADLLLA